MGNLTRRWVILLGCAFILGVFFRFLPEVDILLSQLFFSENAFLLKRESPWLWWSYTALPVVGDILFILIFLSFCASFLNVAFFKKRRVFFLFFLCSALLGPVLLTESIKTFSGRARPINTEIFNGKMPFTPAFTQANFCAKNCSFVSGHVSAATAVFGFFWFLPLVKRRKAFFYCTLFVVAVALSRIIPGAHFLSDCVFGFFITFFALLFTETVFRYCKLLPR